MHLRTFGTPALLDEAESVVVGPGKLLLLLAFLEAHPVGAGREALAALCWGDTPDDRARASLRQAILRLRKALGESAIATEGEQVRLVAPLSSDRATFLEAIHARDDRRACDVYAGGYLAGLDVDDGNGETGWVSSERKRLSTLAQSAMLREARQALSGQDDVRAITLAESAVAADSTVVEGWSLLLEVLTAAGRIGKRDDVLVRLELALRDGIITTDGRRTALAQLKQYRTQGGGAATDSSAGEGFPLVGRQALLARLMARLVRERGDADHSRVVVLEGSAGLGKSRLLREVSRRLTPQGINAVTVTAVASEASTRWSLLTRLVRELTRRPGAAGIHAESLKAFGALDPTLAQRYPGTAPPQREAESLDRLTAALVDLLGSLVEQGDLTLLVDDLHHSDPESIAVLIGAFAHWETAGLSLLAATRPGYRQLPAEWPHWQVAPLDQEAIEALLTEVVDGLQPEDRSEMAASLLLVSGGIPLYLRRATQLLCDDGHLRPGREGRLIVVDRQALLRAVPDLSLHRDPSFPVDPVERRLLGYLTVAEEDVPLEELAVGVGIDDRAALETVLGRLAMAGWVHHAPDSDVARIAHAVLRDQVMSVLGTAMLQQLREQRGRWLAQRGTALVQIQAAVRLLHDSGRDGEAVAAVRAWRRRAAIGRPMGAGVLTPSDSGVLFRWRLSMAMRPRAIVPAAALLVVLAVVLGGWSWRAYMAMPVELVVMNAATIQPMMPEEIARGPLGTNNLPPILMVRNRNGERSTVLDGRPLGVVLLSGADSLTVTPTPVVQKGIVRATSLLAWTGAEPIDSLLVQFSIGKVRSEPTVLWHGWSHYRLQILSGTLAGQPIDSIRPTIRVRAGEPIRGTVEIRYDTPSPSATYALAESSTFEAQGMDTLTVGTLLSGATGAHLVINVDRVAPDTPGTGWLFWATGAERSAEFVLSRTNWNCQRAIWGDGNDMMTESDSVFEQTWGGGSLSGLRRFCHGPEPEWDGRETLTPVAAIRVIVEPGIAAGS